MKRINIGVYINENDEYSLEFRNSYEIKDALKARGYKYYAPLRLWRICKATSTEVIEEIVSLYENHILTDIEDIRELVTLNPIMHDINDEQCKRIFNALNN